MKSNLTVFANFYIDNEERLMRMKDSLRSMKTIKVDRFVVNVRGNFANQAIDYLKSNVESLFAFSIESLTGWFYDTSKLLHLIETPYVLLWIEDHICMAPEDINNVVDEMEKSNSDLLTYSFWQNGKFLQRYAEVDQVDAGVITWFDHTTEVNDRIQNKSYLISYASIIKKSLFDKIIGDRGSEGRWSKMTPFDFEKAKIDNKWLPLRRANPKNELFASIDDDHGEVGSSLQSRGLYPQRSDRQSYAMNSQNRLIVYVKMAMTPVRKFILFIKIIKKIVQTPPKYRRDYVATLMKPAKMDAAPLPWMNYAVIDFIVERMPQINNVFEYGSGQSSLFWLNHGKSIISIEHDPVFYSQLSPKLSRMNEIDYRLVEPEIDATVNPYNHESPQHYHSSDFKGYSFKRYVEAINQFADATFDVVVINGRARPSCITQAINKIKCGGMLILDNSNRAYYLKNTIQYVVDWERYDFIGTVRGLLHHEQTSIFIKPIARRRPEE